MSGLDHDAAEWPLVAIYADESCLGNGREGDNPGGAWARRARSPQASTQEAVRQWNTPRTRQ